MGPSYVSELLQSLQALGKEGGFSLWWARGNCSCDLHPHISTFRDLSICNLPLVPSWVLAVVIGLTLSLRFLRLGPAVSGSLSYSITFAMYAVMISSGLVVHCLFLVECGGQSPVKMYTDFGKVDSSLTSSIAVSFCLNGLVDLGLVRDRSLGFILVSLLLYLMVFVLYFLELLPGWSLYVGSVAVCYSLYLLCQVVVMLRSPGRLSFTALVCLVLGGLFGGGSLWIMLAHYCWLCVKFGAWSIQGVWYYGADLSMLFVGLYVWHTRDLDHAAARRELVVSGLKAKVSR